MIDNTNARRHEEPLQGGQQTDEIVRIGDTVHRTNEPWSPAIRALLDHLETTAPGIAPRSFGLDEQGRDTISFVEGETGHYPLTDAMRSDESMVGVARLIRRYHDATVGLTDRLDLPWATVAPDTGNHEVICHNDLAPYNIIFQNGAPGVVFDFDHAGPGPRVRDVSLAAYRFVPLSSDKRCRTFGWETPPDRVDRLARFIEAYGPIAIEGLLARVEDRIHDLRRNILNLAASDPEKAAPHLESDHIGWYEGDLAWIDANRDALEDVLKTTRVP